MCITPNVVDGRSESQVCPKSNVSTVVGEVQCDPQAVESIREGKVQLLLIHKPESLLSNPSWRDMLRTGVYQDNLSGFVAVCLLNAARAVN